MRLKHLFQIPGTKVRVALVFAWYDLWVGAYIETPSREGMWNIYLMVFTIGILISGPEPWERR